MLQLRDVTLVLIETREHELGLLALEDCERRARFGDVVVFTDRPSMFIRADRRVIAVPDWPNKIGWSRCFWTDVALQVHTSHSLGIQWDAWIVDPTMWSNEFLRYDYIGAPWWYKNGLNVGNGGFSLRSTKLLRYVHKHRDRFPVVNDLDDDLFCRKYRPTLQEAGFVWAPEAIAVNFAFECVRPDPTSRHLGFHAAFNFDYGCEGDDERLLERVQLMARSDYITKRPSWDGLKQKWPVIMGKLANKETEHG